MNQMWMFLLESIKGYQTSSRKYSIDAEKLNNYKKLNGKWHKVHSPWHATKDGIKKHIIHLLEKVQKWKYGDITTYFREN